MERGRIFLIGVALTCAVTAGADGRNDLAKCRRLLRSAAVLAQKPRVIGEPALTELAQRAQGGDASAREALFASLAPTIHLKLLMAKVRLQPADAADAAQEALITIFQSLGDFDAAKGPITNWAGKIAFREGIEAHRKKLRRGRKETLTDDDVLKEMIPQEGRTPEKWVEYEDYLAGLKEAAEVWLQDVPQKHRDIFFLYTMTDYNLLDVGTHFGVSEGQASRVVKAVRAKLEAGLSRPPQ